MAAYEGQQSAFGELTAYVDLSTKQYHFVKLPLMEFLRGLLTAQSPLAMF